MQKIVSLTSQKIISVTLLDDVFIFCWLVNRDDFVVWILAYNNVFRSHQKTQFFLKIHHVLSNNGVYVTSTRHLWLFMTFSYLLSAYITIIINIYFTVTCLSPWITLSVQYSRAQIETLIDYPARCVGHFWTDQIIYKCFTIRKFLSYCVSIQQ